jgi:hypothetical protein
MRGKDNKNRWMQGSADVLNLVGIGRCDIIPNYQTYSNLDPTNIKYSTYKQSRDENLNVIE